MMIEYYIYLLIIQVYSIVLNIWIINPKQYEVWYSYLYYDHWSITNNWFAYNMKPPCCHIGIPTHPIEQIGNHLIAIVNIS